MKFRLFGQDISIGETPVVQTLSVPKEKKWELGSFLDLGPSKLSTEKTVSHKLIKAYHDWVFMNISVLAEEVSKLEPELFKVVMKGGQMEMEQVFQHDVLDLLDRWNEVTTSSDGFYLTEAHLDLTGDAFWYLEGGANGKIPEKIYILQPDNIELQLGDFDKEQGTLVEGYKYKVLIDGKPKEIDYDKDEILHIKVPNPANPYRGQSTVEAIAATIDTDALSNEAVKNFYQNGMIAQFVLTTDQRLNQDQIKRLQAELRAAYTGVRNSWKIPIFGGGVKAENVQMTNKESEFLPTQEWLRDKIMVAFKNTKASLGIVEDVNRANAESTLLNWKRSVIKPKMQRIVDGLNEYLLPRYGENLVLGFKDPVPEDRTSLIAEIEKMYSQHPNPVYTQDEAREMLGLDPLPESERPVDEEKSIPGSIKNVNYKSALRRMGLYTELAERKKLRAEVMPQIKEMVEKKPKKPPKRDYINFWLRVADIIESVEQVFRNRTEQFINQTIEEAQDNLINEELRKRGTLFDKKGKVLEAQAAFAPILMEAVIAAGNEANKLLDIDTPYIPKAVKAEEGIRKQILEQIALFTGSMLDTDQQILTDILARGLESGASIPQIRKEIQDKFSEYTKVQAERITRSEVAQAANRGIVDSYKESGVVVAKQWLTAGDPCPYCEPMNGTIVGLDESYFDKGSEFAGNSDSPLKLDYRSIEEPPLHPNCRCTTIAVIEGVGPLIESRGSDDLRRIVKSKEQAEEIKELEAQIDKRTKEFKELRAKNLENEQYIKELEGLIDE